MRFRATIPGEAYSHNKEKFKKLMKKHGLRWKGTFSSPWWGGETERVDAEYVRDKEKDVTIEAILVWHGNERTPFLEEFLEWVTETGGKVKEELVDEETVMQKIEEELKFWDSIHKPPVNQWREEGRPERWIKEDLKKWRRKREAKRKQLLNKYGIGGK